MSNLRETFDKGVNQINRDGIPDLITWLENETDFFTAPSSSRFHGNYKQGLLEHNLNVLKFALTEFNYLVKEKNEYEYLRESVILASLFHDVAKVNTYKIGKRFTKNNNGKWVNYEAYVFNDDFPLGHGEKSIFHLSKFIKLTNPEAMAIRWHMGKFEPGTGINDVTKWTFEKAWQHPLVKLIHTADVMAGTLDGFVDYETQAKNKD